MIYLSYNVIQRDSMATTVTVRLPDDLANQLADVSRSADRSKSYLIKKAIEQYLDEYADYRIALERLRDADDEVISRKELRKRIG